LDDPGISLAIVDEIGKMECFSGRFREIIRGCLDSPVPFLATIALRGTPPIESVKARPDVRVITMSREDREERYREVREEVRRLVGE
jgi:nucleoside-triphosphatase